MILKALYDYYQARKDELPCEGKEQVEIGFIIVIDKEGNFLRFEDRRCEDKKSADKFLVSKKVGRSSAPIPNYLYDNISYTLGYAKTKGLKEKDIDKEKSKTDKCLAIFKAKVDEAYKKDNASHAALSALKAFYDKDPRTMQELFMKDPLWGEIEKSLTKKYAFFSFRLKGEDFIMAEQPELINLNTELDEKNNETENNNIARCLITGQRGPIVTTTTATMIPGSQAIAKLVAFQVNMGYDSYGNSQCSNAPISKPAEFAYTTALNTMLARNSKNKFSLVDRTFIFWSSSKSEASTEMLNQFWNVLNGQNPSNPDENVQDVEAIFKAILSGKIPSLSDDRFYILGLAPNSARIAVVYWVDMTLKEFAGNLLAHLEDMEIVDNFKEPRFNAGVYQMIAAVTLKRKVSDAPNNLPEAIIKSIFQRFPYPTQLYNYCIGRIRAEQHVTTERAAILKAYLNRINNKHKLTKAMDLNNNDAGYLCGRLFAVIEKIQVDANGIHTVRERYLSPASATPVVAFPTLLNLSIHHVEKLPESRATYYEKLKQEIIGKLAGNFPVHLSNKEQGSFFVGYYQQMQDLYTSKADKEEKNNK